MAGDGRPSDDDELSSDAAIGADACSSNGSIFISSVNNVAVSDTSELLDVVKLREAEWTVRAWRRRLFE